MKSKLLNIVIADDHPLFRHGLRQEILSQLQCQLHEAVDGQAALRLIREVKPDLAILDINMPVLDGLGVIRGMRQERLPGEVIVLTMHKEEDLFEAAMELGVKGYVLKDVAVTEIIHCIGTVMAGSRYISPVFTEYLLAKRASERERAEKKPGLERLTPSERRILKLIAEDRTSKEIALELGLSPRTVENHRTNICAKLGVHGIHSLVKFAYSHRPIG